MPNFALLNNVAHKNLRIIRERTPAYGDNEMSVLTFPQEFRAIQNEYPIFFEKNSESGKFFPVALLGLRRNENLFLSEAGWDAQYVPAAVVRRPFLIGVQPPKPGEDQPNLMVYVDMDSPRLSETQGEPVFLPHGGYAPYLDTVIKTLDYIQYGNELTEKFIAALLELELIEVVMLEITLKNGEQNNLAGFYTINEEKLAALSSDDLGALHSKGYLEFIYMVMASQANVAKLITRIEKKFQQ